MKIRLIVFVRLVNSKESLASKTGALVRFYDPDCKDPHCNFISNFDEKVIWDGEISSGVYELIESQGVYGLNKPKQTITRKQKKWIENFSNCPEDVGTQVNMCTLIKNPETKRQEIIFQTETATRISIFDLHNRLGPIPQNGGQYAIIRTFDSCGIAYSRITTPIKLP